MAPGSTNRYGSAFETASPAPPDRGARSRQRPPAALEAAPDDDLQVLPSHRRSAPSTKGRQRRDRGGGSIVVRSKADGTRVYDAFFTFSDPLTGAARRSCKRGFPTSAAAGAYLRAQTAQVDAGSFVPPTRLTLAQYLDQWLDTLRLAPQTVGNYRVWVQTHLVPHLGHLALSEITPVHLNAMYNTLERTGSHLVCCHISPCGRRDGTGPLSRSSVRHVHNTLSAALRDAVDAGLLASSPTARAKPPTLRQAKAQRSPFATWTAQQLSAFLTRWQDHRYSPLWHLLAATGLRRGEALGLRWQDVDLERGTAAVRQTVGLERTRGGTRETFIQPTVKNGRPHMIALDPGTVGVLRRHRADQDEQRRQLGERWTDLDLVFCRDAGWLAVDSRPGQPLRGERVSALWRELAERTPEVPRIRLHDLRHTWATLALAQGVLARTSCGTGASAGLPEALLWSASRSERCRRNGDTSALTRYGAPRRVASRTAVSSVPPAHRPAAIWSASGCRPRPNSARICASLTGPPSNSDSLTRPRPNQTPGDSPCSA